MAIDFNSKYALITGASTGIGCELARVMASDGWNLILVARREHLLEKLAEELRRRNGTESLIFGKDLSLPDSADDLYAAIEAQGLSIDALINNAGFGDVGEFIRSDYEKVGKMISLNVLTLTKLTHLYLPTLVNKGMGWILNVGSIAGTIPLPYFAAYSGSKAYVNFFSQALAAELEGTGVHVSCLAPGPTRETDFAKVAGYKNPNKDKEPGTIDAHTCALAGYNGMLQGKRMIITGPFSKLPGLFYRFLPHDSLVDIARTVMMKRTR